MRIKVTFLYQIPFVKWTQKPFRLALHFVEQIEFLRIKMRNISFQPEMKKKKKKKLKKKKIEI